jgi:GNAT superfamily N-acetyltransferase
MSKEWTRGSFIISTDPEKLQLDRIHKILKDAYWCKNIPFDVMARAIANSLPFGLYTDNNQVGFARVITDFATYAYIGDVYLEDLHRGQGLGVWLMEMILAHPELQGFRRWVLATRDAHGLYEKIGFTKLNKPEIFMERWAPNVYESD